MLRFVLTSMRGGMIEYARIVGIDVNSAKCGCRAVIFCAIQSDMFWQLEREYSCLSEHMCSSDFKHSYARRLSLFSCLWGMISNFISFSHTYDQLFDCHMQFIRCDRFNGSLLLILGVTVAITNIQLFRQWRLLALYASTCSIGFELFSEAYANFSIFCSVKMDKSSMQLSTGCRAASSSAAATSTGQSKSSVGDLSNSIRSFLQSWMAQFRTYPVKKILFFHFFLLTLCMSSLQSSCLLLAQDQRGYTFQFVGVKFDGFGDSGFCLITFFQIYEFTHCVQAGYSESLIAFFSK